MTTTHDEAYPCGPAADGLDTEHWHGLRQGELRIQRCATCRAWLWGPRRICGHCHGFDLTWEAVPAQGTVYTWCRSRHPYMSELADLLPYVSVLVELPHAGNVRVLGLLTGDTDGVRIGDEVVGHIEQPATAEWPLLRWRRAAQTPEGER